MRSTLMTSCTSQNLKFRSYERTQNRKTRGNYAVPIKFGNTFGQIKKPESISRAFRTKHIFLSDEVINNFVRKTQTEKERFKKVRGLEMASKNHVFYLAEKTCTHVTVRCNKGPK